MDNILLIQLPLHPFTAWEPTGNIPLAPALLAAAADLPPTSVMQQESLNYLGDKALFNLIKQKKPALLAVTFYLWNRDRTIYLIRKLKNWNNELIVIAGGPEITADNHILLGEESIDLFVIGEGEPYAKDIFSLKSVKAILNSGNRVLGPVTNLKPPHFWPDPYEKGILTITPKGSAHIESQRGCSSTCSYCAYRKTSPVPRIVPADIVLNKIKSLHEKGVSELVFLDPTFNKRPDLDFLLSGLSEFSIDSFAEIRADIIHSQETADSLKKAGFHSLEVGLQTFNNIVLKAIGRGGNPNSVLRGAGYLKRSGITPIIDLILGLPGDTPNSIIKAANELVKLGLNDQVQAFILSILPGTELKSTAKELGLTYNINPPYNITTSAPFSLADLLQTREEVSDILGYDPDPPPRPVLSESFPGMEIFIPESSISTISPSVRHGVLRINTANAWKYRSQILNKIRERRENDPYCPLDIIINSEQQFPFDLFDLINQIGEPSCYTTQKAGIYGLPGLIRLAVIAPSELDQSWLTECSQYAVTVIQSAEPVTLPGGQIGLLLEGQFNLSELSSLYTQAPHLVFFVDQNLEKLWNLDILELS